MKRRVISSPANITIRKAAEIMVKYHIGTLPIVDPESHLIAVVTLRNLLVPAIPDFFELVEDLDFVHDFGAAEHEKPDQDFLNSPITQIAKDPVYVEESAGLVRAITLLQEHNLYDLPVVDDEMRLVGIASQVDVGIALIKNWPSNL
jgi:CBS-domain-containing membrane protein